MAESQINIHALDAAYKPFPSFEEWAAKTTVDTVRWSRYKAALENRPELSGAAFQRAREIVKRATALDTGAIEGLYEVDRGFTFTVAMEATAWELELAKKGEHVRPLFEAQMHAYDYVLDLATKAEQLSEAAIRKLHEVVCAAQETYRVVTAIGFQEQPLPKGRYKVLPNHVIHTREGTTHSYAPVDVTPVEMARLVSEMRSEAFLAAHPVMQAAYAHYGLVVVHPFADGNGRVARALASVFTYRVISMPIMILSEHKETYLDALEAADSGQCQRFVDFMLDRSLDTIQLVNESLKGLHAPSPEESLASIDKLYSTRGGYTFREVDECGMRLIELVRGELNKWSARNPSPNLSLQSRVDTVGRVAEDSKYRKPMQGDGQVLVIRLSSAAPASAHAIRTYHLFLPKDAGREDDVLLERADGKDAFSARMSELGPSTSGALQIRIGVFVERVLREMLSELRSIAEAHSRRQS